MLSRPIAAMRLIKNSILAISRQQLASCIACRDLGPSFSSSVSRKWLATVSALTASRARRRRPRWLDPPPL